MIQFRPYQEAAIQSARDKIAAGVKRILLNSPTGSGKTIIAAGIVQRAVAKGKRVLFLAHRRELIHQTCAKLVEGGVLNFGVIMAGHRINHAAAPVQVASIQTLVRRELPPADLVIIDECLTGDSLISTDKGAIQIKDIRSGMRAMSYNGRDVVYSEITDVWTSGEKDVLEIAVETGETIRCTENHLLMTKDGWTKAKDITQLSQLLLANAVAGQCCKKTSGDGSRFAFLGISKRCAQEQHASGKRNTSLLLQQRLYALADAAKEYAQNTGSLWINLSDHKDLDHFTNTSRDTTAGVHRGTSRWTRQSVKQFLGLFLGTQAFFIRTGKAARPVFASTTAGLNLNGQSIKRIFLKGLAGKYQERNPRGMGLLRFLVRLDAFLILRGFTSFAFMADGNLSAVNGLNRLETLGLLGGSAMTGQAADAAYTCTQRDSHWKRMKSSANGLETDTAQQKYRPESADITGFTYPQTLNEKYSQSSSDIYPNACNTSWHQVARVQRLPRKEAVYDITVAGTHCFFANGILTHNCHRAASRSYLSVLANYPQAAVIGLSATPERLDGKGLDDIFHDMVVVATVPDLIEMGFLVKPTCYVGATADLTGVATRRGDYDEGQLAEAMDKPKLTGDIVANWLRLARGRPTAVFAAGVEHAQHITAEFVAAGIPAATVTGDTPQQERDAIIADWRAGFIQVCVNVFIFVEGFDFPELECVVLARPTQSVSLYLQAVGRVMRPAPSKHQAIIIDHAGCCQIHGQPHLHREWTLEGMAKKRKKQGQELHQVCQPCGMVFEAEPTLWLEETQPALRPAFVPAAQRLLAGSEKGRGMATCPGCSAASCLVCGGHFEVHKTKQAIDGIATSNIAVCATCAARYSDVPQLLPADHEAYIPTTTQDDLVAMGDEVPIKVTVLNDYKRLINEAKRHGRKRGWAYWRLKEKYDDGVLRDCLPRHTGQWWKEQAR